MTDPTEIAAASEIEVHHKRRPKWQPRQRILMVLIDGGDEDLLLKRFTKALMIKGGGAGDLHFCRH